MALLGAAVLVLMSTVILVIASMQKLGPWITASGTGGVLLATALGVVSRRWRIARGGERARRSAGRGAGKLGQ